MVSFGERLREERERLKLSQTDFGLIAKVTKKTQGLYEADKRYPDSTYLTAIASAGVDVGYLLTGNLPIAPMVYPTGGLNSSHTARQVLLSEREYALLDDFRALGDKEKDAAETMLNAVAKHQVKKKA